MSGRYLGFQPSHKNTIYAISTGLGKAAIAVVRVSGEQCSSILERICPGVIFRDREVKLTLLLDADQIGFDRAIVIRFFAPRSYTGEDMIEFHVTGSRAVLACLVRQISNVPDARPAEAGEFAIRAFENGKLDLMEIEGLASVLAAETNAQLRHAMKMASGALSRRCEQVRTLILHAIASIESLLDFSDVEDARESSIEDAVPSILEAVSILAGIEGDSRISERLRDGLVVVIAGAPNVGKSTLLNYLAKRDVAIVSSLPGTTRDSLEVAADIGGFPVTFIDTAGIRETADALESQGIARTLERAETADLVLWLFDEESDVACWNVEKPVLRVETKADLRAELSLDSDVYAISAKTGVGIAELLEEIRKFCLTHFEGFGSVMLGTERQRLAVSDAKCALARVLATPDLEVEMVAEELRQAAHAMGRLTGRIAVEEVLTEIFSRLCVGK